MKTMNFTMSYLQPMAGRGLVVAPLLYSKEKADEGHCRPATESRVDKRARCIDYR